MEIVRSELTVNDVQPPNTRYDPDCECVQTTTDDGATWQDNPAADPRSNGAYLLPPRGGSDPRCDAAEAMMQHFKAMVDRYLAESAILASVNALIALVAVFFPPAALFSVLWFVIVDGLNTIGSTVVDAAMTDPVYDQFKCIFYCNLTLDGRVTEIGLAAMQTAINDDIGGVPNIVFDLFAGALGVVGWSNAAASGEYTGDCAECDECCALYDFTVSEAGWQVAPVRCGALTTTYAAGLGWQANTSCPPPNDWVDAAICLNVADMTYTGWGFIGSSSESSGIYIQFFRASDGAKIAEDNVNVGPLSHSGFLHEDFFTGGILDNFTGRIVVQMIGLYPNHGWIEQVQLCN